MSNTEDRSMQVEALREALSLQTTISKYETQLLSLRSQRYQLAPQPPAQPTRGETDDVFAGLLPPRPIEEKVIKPPMPKSKLKFLDYTRTNTPTWQWVVFAVSLFVLFVIPIAPFLVLYKYKKYKDAVEQDIARIRATPEFQAECAAAEKAEADRKAKEYAEHTAKVADYERKLKHYNEIVLPKYEQDKKAWENNTRLEISEKDILLQDARRVLAAHYEKTGVVPAQYRSLKALKYLYELMSTSTYTITEAIANYEQSQSRVINTQQLFVQMENLNETRRAAAAAEDAAYYSQRAADAADEIAHNTQRTESTSSKTSNTGPERKDYSHSSSCMLSKSMSCKGCSLAPFCTKYR